MKVSPSFTLVPTKYSILPLANSVNTLLMKLAHMRSMLILSEKCAKTFKIAILNQIFSSGMICLDIGPFKISRDLEFKVYKRFNLAFGSMEATAITLTQR